MRSALVSAVELAEELVGDRPPVVLDVRWTLAGSDRAGYLAGHIPGAVFIDLDRELAAPVGDGGGGRHPLPDPQLLQDSWRAAGIQDGDPVVVYDAKDSAAAARCWWLLRWSGVHEARVLDGGLAAWEVARLPVRAGEPAAPKPGELTVRPGSMPTVDADQAGALAAAGLLVDARAAARFRGDVEPIDPKAGHLPGAVNLPFTQQLTQDGRFRPAPQLRSDFDAVGIDGTVAAAASCGSGVTACHLILAAEVAGIELALYPGSWSQWCALGRPVATG